MSSETALYGCVDRQGAVISGWAYDPEAVDNKCCLEITVGDHVISYLAGKDHRPDVALNLGFEKADYCGFSLDLSPFFPAGPVVVSVRFKKNMQLLHDGQFVFDVASTRLTIFEGIDGYWFYTGDKSDVIRHINGATAFSQTEVMYMAMMLSVAASVTEAQGGAHVFCIAPDKIVVHPRVFGIGFKPFSGRASQTLISQYRDFFGRHALYPLASLSKKIGPGKSITRTDSHLSWRAQCHIAQTILAEAGYAQAFKKLRIKWEYRDSVHDLAKANGSDLVEAEEMPIIDNAALRFFPVVGSDALICYNATGSIPLVLMFGTSSCRQLSSFIAHVAKVTVHIWSTEPDIRLIKELEPRLVINYIPERSLPLIAKNFSATGSHVKAKILEAIAAGDEVIDLTESGAANDTGQSGTSALEVMNRPRRDRLKPWPVPMN